MKAAVIVLLTCLLFWTVAAGVSPDKTDWLYWRGPAADGMAVGDAPLHWSDTQNVRWKADIPGRGHSSPVIAGDRIFVTTAIPTGQSAGQDAAPSPPPAQTMGRGPGGGFGVAEHNFDLLCLDRKTGKLLWQRTAKTAVPHEGYHQTYGSFASNSPVTDGKHVYAFFGSRGLYCYDLNGNLIWQKDFGVQLRMKLAFGEGTAPFLYGDRIVLVFDQDVEPSFMVVLDKNTGKEIWRVNRDEKSTWAAPLVLEYGGRKQIVITATNKVRSYDFETGKVIWECGGLGVNTIPAPVHQDDLVFVMSGYINPKLMAIRLGREGDLTGSDAVVWSQTKGNSYTPSPVLHDNKLYVLTDNGLISCYNARTGEPYYHQTRLPKTYNFKASPVGANGKLYLASENEDVIVLRMGEKYEVLATNTMPNEVFISTPAIAGNELFLRSQKHLYCVHENQ